MKILRIMLPLAVFVLSSSFVVTKIRNNATSSAIVISKKPLAQKTVDPLYQKFIEKFDKIDFPFAIRFEKPKITSTERQPEIGTKDESNYLGKSFAVFLPEIKEGMMSRMGPDDFMAEALIKSTDKFDAVIYSREGNFRGPKSFYAATFNKKGKLISKIEVGHYNYENLKEFTVYSNMDIIVEDIKVRSRYDENSGITRNSYAKTPKKVYVINAQGIIVNKDVDMSNDLGMK